MFYEDDKLCMYAFVQHTLRELRAHWATWTASAQGDPPRGLRGRAGLEHCLRNAIDLHAVAVLQDPPAWPFHLAGDSGVRLFEHRAWLSWRYLALLELPTLELWQLPPLSAELEALINSTRTQAPRDAQLDEHTVTAVLVEFFHDATGHHAKGRWLRRALKLRAECEEALVLEQLDLAVAHAFAVLQSLLTRMPDAELKLSARALACIALVLHLQRSTTETSLGFWQPALFQERSAQSQSDARNKRYVTSEQLGSDDSSPLSQFPQVLAHLCSEASAAQPAARLDPTVHPIATPPVLCWQCGKGFTSQDALWRHAQRAHGGWAEYRKHLFWYAQRQGFLPLLPWQKRHMLANFAFFQCHSIPESGGIEWNVARHGSVAQPAASLMNSAVPRQEIGCAICARRDWIEHRFRVYLWRSPDNASTELHNPCPESETQDPSLGEELGQKEDAPDLDIHGEAPRAKLHQRTMSDGCFCLGNAHIVDRYLATHKYAKLMPLIPEEELYASSVQHPFHPEMRWLLHTRRVPCLSQEEAETQLQTSGAAQPSGGAAQPAGIADSRCAGVGDPNATVWCCKDCVNNLCRPDANIGMPPPALANLMWLGREHPLCQNASVGTRMLSCLGRAVWRKLILGTRGYKRIPPHMWWRSF